MNEEQIETLLQKTPLLKTPDSLLDKIKGDIRLPKVSAPRPEWNPPPSWFKRWLPALSFATVFLVCLVAIGVQTNTISQLRDDNAALKARPVNLQPSENSELQKLRASSDELDRLRKDNAELKRLRGEIAQMQSQLPNLETLRAENQKLRTAASQSSATTNAEGDFFSDAKARAERIMCVNNLKQIGLAARVWAGDNKDIYPSEFITMTNELVNWKLLQCPSDKAHIVTGWGDVAAGNISYIIDAPGITGTMPQVIYVECPIHHNICLVDGSVQQMSEESMRLHVKVVNGLKELSQ